MSTPTDTKRRGLPLWATLALSLALVGPTLAMSGNGQGLVGSVGKGVPLVLVLGLVVVGLVAYGFVRLTRHMNHAGSAYALVGRTVGPRAGFFSGFAMIGTYLGFATGTVALFSAFTNDLLLELQGGREGAFQLPWIVPAIFAVGCAALMAAVDTKLIMAILMVLEGVGIVAMVVLSFVIFGRGGAPATGVDWSAFSFSHGVGGSAVIGGIVTAFLTWAGFEACATLGEETDEPQRNIPRTLIGTLLITGVLFVFVMFAQTVGFGTDAAGLKAFQSSGSTLGTLGARYIGSWFSLVVVFTAMMSAFACHVASVSTTGRLLMAFARDGFGPRWLARIDARSGAPKEAVWLVIAATFVINLLSWATRWPDMGTGNAALDSYIMFATTGAVCLMVAYLMVEVAAMYFLAARRFAAVTGRRGLVLGVGIPALGLVSILVVLYFNISGQSTVFSPPYFALAWLAVGLVVALAAKGLTARIGAHLADEIRFAEDVPAGTVASTPSGAGL